VKVWIQKVISINGGLMVKNIIGSPLGVDAGLVEKLCFKVAPSSRNLSEKGGLNCRGQFNLIFAREK
jgi:hypothetical protein